MGFDFQIFVLISLALSIWNKEGLLDLIAICIWWSRVIIVEITVIRE